MGVEVWPSPVSSKPSPAVLLSRDAMIRDAKMPEIYEMELEKGRQQSYTVIYNKKGHCKDPTSSQQTVGLTFSHLLFVKTRMFSGTAYGEQPQPRSATPTRWK